MPHYFFHVRDGRDAPDLVGMELSSFREAKREAIVLAGALLTSPGRRFWRASDWSIDVADEEGELLLTLTFYRSVAEVMGLDTMA